MNPECQIMPEFPLMPSRRPRSRVVPNRRTQRRVGVPNYGFRYLDPLTGRWPSRDPLGEGSHMPVYSILGNACLNSIDILGLFGPATLELRQALSANFTPTSIPPPNDDIAACPDWVGKAITEVPYALFHKAAKKSGCTLWIRCECNNEKGTDAETSYNSRARIARILLFYPPSGTPDRESFLHELVHARDYCAGWVSGDCRSHACTEVKAYEAQMFWMSSLSYSNWPREVLRKTLIEKAALSLAAYGKCGTVREAKRLVEEVYDGCIENSMSR